MFKFTPRYLQVFYLRLLNYIILYFFCFSLEYQKELIAFNAQPIYATLSEYMLCDKQKLLKKVNQLVDSEEAKISEPVERYKVLNYLYI